MKWAKPTKRTEADYARVVVDHLRETGWTTYEEVVLGSHWPRPDIVATRGPHLAVVEVKTTLSLDLMAQAQWWTGYAHLVWCATPYPRKRNRGRGVALRWLRDQRIGLFEVEPTDRREFFDCREVVAPRTNKRALVHRVRPHLHPDQGSGEWARAGEQGGKLRTPFALTVKELKKYVREHPGCTAKAAIDAIDHHYASDKSARGALVGLIRSGVVAGVGVVEERPLRLEPR